MQWRCVTRNAGQSLAALRCAAALTVCLLSGCASVQDSLYDAGLSVVRWQFNLTEKRAGVGAGAFAYVERQSEDAKAAPTIVLLHGFAGHKDLWLQFISHLPARYRVIALDMPGHGDSAGDLTRDYDPRSLTLSVARAIDALGIESFHLAGSSLGGLVATLYAIEYPLQVKTLGLFAPAGVYPTVPSELQRRLDRGENPLLVSTHEGFDRLMEFVFVDPPFMPWPVRPVLARDYMRRAPVNAKIWADLVGGFTDIRERLPDVRAPVFILWGEADRVLHVSSLDVYAEYLPAAEIHVVDNGGHAPMVEHAPTTATLYSHFLKRHQSP